MLCLRRPQVFDAGLIGEGALHIYASVQANLVAETYTLVPSSATVYCQVIEMRTGCVQGFDLSQLNRYRWRPDYEGHELGGCRSAWRPLTDVKEVAARVTFSSHHLHRQHRCKFWRRTG